MSMIGWMKVQAGFTVVIIMALFLFMRDPFPAMVIVLLISILIMIPNTINAISEEMSFFIQSKR